MLGQVRTWLLCLLCSCIVEAHSVQAQHAIEVQRAAANGDYMVALTTFERMPLRASNTASTIAAARSAWALSLSRKAVEEYDRALLDENLSLTDRARIYLSKGIIEFQDAHYQVAALHVQKAAAVLHDKVEASAIRAKAYFVWGEALSQQQLFGDAESKYQKALEGAASEDLPQIHYALGKCRLQLGKYEDARKELEQIPLGHELTPLAIRGLARIGLEMQKPENVSFWLTKGRQDFPDSFLDSWVDYALVNVAIDQDKLEEVRLIRSSAVKKFPPSDPWMTLLDAAAEGYEWSRLQNERAALTSGGR